jgi:hypothetical protein
MWSYTFLLIISFYNSFYNKKSCWAKIRKQQNLSRDQNEWLEWPRSEVMQANNRKPPSLRKDMRRHQNRRWSRFVPPKSTSFVFWVIYSMAFTMDIFQAVGMFWALDYSNKQIWSLKTKYSFHFNGQLWWISLR